TFSLKGAIMLKIGVVGVGHLGRHHARILSTLSNCTMIGIYDKDPKRSKEIAKEFNLASFTSYEDLLNNVDAVDIAVTTTYHYELAKIALELKKHVFIEKPITTTVAQGEELVALAKANNVKIQVGHIERFNPVIMKSAALIGSPLFIESHRLHKFSHRGTDVPVVLDLMIHDIDLILSFVKSDLVNVQASGIGIVTKSIDIANARLEFANGAVANITTSRISMKMERKIRFFQKDAYISVNFQDKEVVAIRKSKDLKKILPAILLGKKNFNPEDLVEQEVITAEDIVKDALTMELESFITAIENDTDPICSGEDGLQALRVAQRIIDEINSHLVMAGEK
ncbi:MAG: Gfo/Idh/MocA family oxidoreductase, partial [Candidatus Zophobacter franzmannii]|nr:Gfo/Idh/MocA family oxidoreductase [Candidatus Zophobacter franzmannii]